MTTSLAELVSAHPFFAGLSGKLSQRRRMRSERVDQCR